MLNWGSIKLKLCIYQNKNFVSEKASYRAENIYEKYNRFIYRIYREL